MAPYHRLEQDIDWEEEAEQLRLEGFTSNDLEPEVEPETDLMRRSQRRTCGH
jgi:hypothetical protein